jgi:hypothetical protein
MTQLLIHSFAPCTEYGGVGGFDWGIRGTPAGDQVLAQFALDTDAAHHDYIPTHVHRLLERTIPDDIIGHAITDLIDDDLDRIEGGEFDKTPALLAKHDPRTLPTGEQL